MPRPTCWTRISHTSGSSCWPPTWVSGRAEQAAASCRIDPIIPVEVNDGWGTFDKYMSKIMPAFPWRAGPWDSSSRFMAASCWCWFCWSSLRWLPLPTPCAAGTSRSTIACSSDATGILARRDDVLMAFIARRAHATLGSLRLLAASEPWRRQNRSMSRPTSIPGRPTCRMSRPLPVHAGWPHHHRWRTREHPAYIQDAYRDYRDRGAPALAMPRVVMDGGRPLVILGTPLAGSAGVVLASFHLDQMLGTFAGSLARQQRPPHSLDGVRAGAGRWLLRSPLRATICSRGNRRPIRPHCSRRCSPDTQGDACWRGRWPLYRCAASNIAITPRA